MRQIDNDVLMRGLILTPESPASFGGPCARPRNPSPPPIQLRSLFIVYDRSFANLHIVRLNSRSAVCGVQLNLEILLTTYCIVIGNTCALALALQSPICVLLTVYEPQRILVID